MFRGSVGHYSEDIFRGSVGHLSEDVSRQCGTFVSRSISGALGQCGTIVSSVGQSAYVLGKCGTFVSRCFGVVWDNCQQMFRNSVGQL